MHTLHWEVGLGSRQWLQRSERAGKRHAGAERKSRLLAGMAVVATKKRPLAGEEEMARVLAMSAEQAAEEAMPELVEEAGGSSGGS